PVDDRGRDAAALGPGHVDGVGLEELVRTGDQQVGRTSQGVVLGRGGHGGEHPRRRLGPASELGDGGCVRGGEIGAHGRQGYRRASPSRDLSASSVSPMAARRPGPGGLLRSSAAVSVGVGLSRVTGLVRTAVLAAVIGTTALADGYNLANSTPNVIYDLMLGGVLAATLIPV